MTSTSNSLAPAEWRLQRSMGITEIHESVDLSPLGMARRLAGIYGHEIDEPPTYPAGVAMAGRLRLARHDGETSAAVTAITQLASPLIDDPSRIPSAGPCLAVGVYADELYTLTNDPRHRDHVIELANRMPLDPDIRVEDFFFAGAMLGRAYRLTADRAFADRLAEYLLAADTQQANGLFWHCHQSPYFWGRGNAFAAMGLAEAISYLDDHPQRDHLVARARAHMLAMRAHASDDGLWHQVLDDASTYLEHSATTMIGYSIARGIKGGWLESNDWLPFAVQVWRAVAARIAPDGALEQVCVGTGPLDDLQAYRDRPFTTGPDARGGAMALIFAVEMLDLV